MAYTYSGIELLHKSGAHPLLALVASTSALMKQFISHDPPDGGHPHSYLLLVMCGFAFSCAFLLLVVFFSFSCDSVAVFMFFSWEFVFFMGNHN